MVKRWREAYLYIRHMTFHPQPLNQAFVSPTRLIRITENGDENQANLSGGKGRVMVTLVRTCDTNMNGDNDGSVVSYGGQCKHEEVSARARA